MLAAEGAATRDSPHFGAGGCHFFGAPRPGPPVQGQIFGEQFSERGGVKKIAP